MNLNYFVKMGDAYEFIPGKRAVSEWVFVKEERYIYTPINKDKNGRRFKCFGPNCDARLTIRTNELLVNGKKSHVDHAVHDDEMRARLTISNVKTKCQKIEELCGSQRVSVKDIFDREMNE